MITRVFVSDIYMGKGGQVWDWPSPDQAAHFLDFLGYVRGEASFQELILLGDIFDTWVCPMDVKPPSFIDIVESNKQVPLILSKVREISSNKKVVYAIGNHDMAITKDTIPDFGNGAGDKISFMDEYNTGDGISASHGHSYSMYNAKDPVYTLPIGYFITRFQATIDRNEGTMGRWSETLDKADTLDARKLASPYIDWPLDYFAARLDMDNHTAVVMEDGSVVTLGRVREMFHDLPDRWKEAGNVLGPFDGVIAEAMHALDTAAQGLINVDGKKSVIYGHTHWAVLKQIFKDVLGPTGEPDKVYTGIYSNPDCWCHKNPGFNYVIDRYDEVASRHTVTLMRWWPRNEQVAPSLTI